MDEEGWSIMASKPRSEWSESYRRRIERAEAQGKTRQQARGHHGNEHQQRKERTRAKGFGELTQTQIKQMRRYGATDDDLKKAARMDQDKLRKLLRNQRDHEKNPRYSARKSMRQLLNDNPDAPDVLFFYHSAAWSGRRAS